MMGTWAFRLGALLCACAGSELTTEDTESTEKKIFSAFSVSSVVFLPQAAAPKPVEPQDPDRPRMGAKDYQALLDNNIFSPPRPAKTGSKPKPEEKASEAPAVPRPPVVTGFVTDPKTRVPQVVVEDRNSDAKLKLFKEPKFLKAGDEVAGYTIEAVTGDVVTVSHGETRKDLKIGESFSGEVTPPPETGAKGEEKPAVEPSKRNVLEELRNRRKNKKDFGE